MADENIIRNIASQKILKLTLVIEFALRKTISPMLEQSPWTGSGTKNAI